MRYVIIYKNDQEGMNSLKEMSKHLDGLIHEGERGIPISAKRDIRTVPRLPMSLRSKMIDRIAFTVNGTVTDQDGEPLIGVNIQVKGSSKGTATDFDGRFTLEDVDENAVLVISYVGYQTQEVPIAGKSDLEIVMTSDAELLDEIVVVGYGTQRKINLTGSVDQIAGEDFQNRSINNVAQGLQGAMPNVNIDMIEGKPISAPAVNIRGVTSIGAGGNALVLIDGVEGDISMLNPNDIESITVLKDASSAAIYGARGSFGVVLVTTKNPEKQKLTISYSGSYGMKQPTVPQNRYVNNGYEYARRFVESFENWEGTFPQNANKSLAFSQEYLNELKRRDEDPSLSKTEVGSDGSYRYYHNTDWHGYLFRRKSFMDNHNITVSGGSENVEF